MVRAIRHFLDFCYVARRNIVDKVSLDAMRESLAAFHREREIFVTTGTCKGPISLPRQHSMMHYPRNIEKFGAPNGLCTSITESRHIKAVKEPWRRSNRYNALSQMLVSNQRLDKLAAARVDFINRGMLAGSCLSSVYDLRQARELEANETPGEFKYQSAVLSGAYTHISFHLRRGPTS